MIPAPFLFFQVDVEPSLYENNKSLSFDYSGHFLEIHGTEGKHRLY